MAYFIKLTSSYTTGNKLQTFVTNAIRGIDQTQLENPQELIDFLTNTVDLGNYTFTRCTPLKVSSRKLVPISSKQGNPEDQDRTILVEVDGLITFTLYKIVGIFDKKAAALKSASASTLSIFN